MIIVLVPGAAVVIGLRARESLRAGGIEVVAGDITDEAAVRRACADVRIVYNIAAIYRQAGLGDAPD